MSRRSWLILTIFLAGIGAFYLATLRPGHPWADDFSMYVHHAKNIVLGIDYQATGYVYDKMYAVIGPRYYPPVYPLLLAPIYALSGLNLAPMKVEIVLFFMLFLVVLAISFRKELPFAYLAGAVVVLGLNPYFWDFKDDPVSDIPFLFFLYLCFFAIQRYYDRPLQTRPGWKYAILVGALITLADGTRTVGILILPALLILDIWRTRRLNLFSFIACGVAGLGYLAQSLVISGPSGYGDQFVFYPPVFPINLHAYFNALVSLWANGYSVAAQMVLFVILLVLAAWGAVVRLRNRGMTIYELYSVFYIALIIVWRANQGVRFLIPLIPLFVIDIFTAVKQIGSLAFRSAGIMERLALSVVLVAIGLSYLGVYSQTSFGPFTSGVEQPESIALFNFIKGNTRPDDLLIYSRPRALALYTGRKSAGYSILENEQFTINYSRYLGATYFIVGQGEDYLRLLVKRYPADFNLVYKNAGFSMYAFKTP